LCRDGVRVHLRIMVAYDLFAEKSLNDFRVLSYMIFQRKDRILIKISDATKAQTIRWPAYALPPCRTSNL
jgi:hypothetical protein